MFLLFDDKCGSVGKKRGRKKLNSMQNLRESQRHISLCKIFPFNVVWKTIIQYFNYNMGTFLLTIAIQSIYIRQRAILCKVVGCNRILCKVRYWGWQEKATSYAKLWNEEGV